MYREKRGLKQKRVAGASDALMLIGCDPSELVSRDFSKALSKKLTDIVCRQSTHLLYKR